MAFLQIDYKSEALMRGVNIKVILPSDGMAGKWEPPYKTLVFTAGLQCNRDGTYHIPWAERTI